MMIGRGEIGHLYDLEYGRAYALLRLSVVTACAILFYSYTHSPTAFVWLGLYLACHLVYFAFLRRHRAEGGPREMVIAGYIFAATAAAFVWLPSTLISASDPALATGGASALGTLLVFLIYRAGTALGPMVAQIAIVSTAIGWGVMPVILRLPQSSPRCVVLLAATALGLYFALTMLAIRRQRIEAEAAALRLARMQKMEAVGQLAGGVAHDFNNILTVVIGNLDLYDVLEDTDERDTCVREARAAAERAAELVRRLLAYARRAPMQPARHEVSALLEQVQILTRRLLPATVEMRFEPLAERLAVIVDPNQFTTAMVNLVVNAREAMPSGGRVTLSAGLTTLGAPRLQSDGEPLGPGSFAAITVADTGAGIAPDHLGRVTEPFFTTKTVGTGPGLGLSMAEGFARQSGGALSLSSTPGGGTRVSLLLPVAGPVATRA